MRRMGAAKTATDIGAEQFMDLTVIKLVLRAIKQRIKALFIRIIQGEVARFDFSFGVNNTFAVGQLFIGEEAGTAAIHFQDQLVAHETFVGEEEQQGIAIAGKVIDGNIVAQGVATAR